MTPFHDPLQNRLLAALPGAELQCLLPHLKPVAMPLGMVLYEPGSTQSHAYFPTTAIVSLLYIIESGASAEIAVVGCEGLVGVSLVMGGESTPSRAVVQSAGMGFRLKGQVIRDEMEHSSARPERSTSKADRLLQRQPSARSILASTMKMANAWAR